MPLDDSTILSFTSPERKMTYLVFAWVMRGNEMPPDPVGLSAAELDHVLLSRRRHLLGHRRITPELEGIIRGAIDWACRSRHCHIHDLIFCSTCVFLLAEGPSGLLFRASGMHQAVRHFVAQRARRMLLWPRHERVFRTTEFYRQIDTVAAAKLRERLPRLAEL